MKKYTILAAMAIAFSAVAQSGCSLLFLQDPTILS